MLVIFSHNAPMLHSGMYHQACNPSLKDPSTGRNLPRWDGSLFPMRHKYYVLVIKIINSLLESSCVIVDSNSFWKFHFDYCFVRLLSRLFTGWSFIIIVYYVYVNCIFTQFFLKIHISIYLFTYIHICLSQTKLMTRTELKYFPLCDYTGGAHYQGTYDEEWDHDDWLPAVRGSCELYPYGVRQSCDDHTRCGLDCWWDREAWSRYRYCRLRSASSCCQSDNKISHFYYYFFIYELNAI